MSKPIRMSQSFSPEETKWLDDVFRMLLRGGDVRQLLHGGKEGASILRKIRSMRRRFEEARAKNGENGANGNMGPNEQEAL